MSNPTVPIELIEQVAKKGCVLFLGWSFPHAPSNMLTDKVLSEKLSQRINFNEPGKSLDEVAEYFEAERGKVALIQYVSDVISSYDTPPVYYREILGLPFNIIVSTSLDNYVKHLLYERREKFDYVMRDEEITFIN